MGLSLISLITYIQVARNPGAWFITNGVNSGVTREVGAAVYGSQATCVGIMSWGALHGKEKLFPRHEDDSNINNQIYQVTNCRMIFLFKILIFSRQDRKLSVVMTS